VEGTSRNTFCWFPPLKEVIGSSEVINGDLFNFSSVPLVNIELPHVTSWKMLFDKLLVDND
jgi:hypothetical protein